MDSGSLLRRMAFFLRFDLQTNLLFSSQVKSDSRLVFRRDIRERVEALAPFLAYDADPYPVILDGRVIWVMDAYTHSTRFPYGEVADVREVDSSSGLSTRLNYVRNSVKVTVDAYDGTVKFYVIDPDDPMVRAYRQMFPDLFTDEEPPEELKEHWRYPEDLFRAQTNMWGRYRLGPDQFYDRSGAWAVAQDPGDEVGQTPEEQRTEDEQGNVISVSERRIDPQYLLLRLPGDTEESFVMFRPFVPFTRAQLAPTDERKDLVSFMVARSDGDRYGELEVFELDGDTRVDGPAQFNSNVLTEVEISETVALLNREGSRVRPGNLLLIPVAGSLVYVRPLYVEATGSTSVPELQQVIVGVSDRIEMRPRFVEALESVIPGLDLPDTVPPPTEAPPEEPEEPDGGDPGTETPGTTEPEQPGTTQPETPGTTQPEQPGTTDPGTGEPTDPVQALLLELDAAYEAKDEALRQGDLAAYQEAVDHAEEITQQLLAAMGLELDPSTTSAVASMVRPGG